MLTEVVILKHFYSPFFKRNRLENPILYNGRLWRTCDGMYMGRLTNITYNVQFAPP